MTLFMIKKNKKIKQGQNEDLASTSNVHTTALPIPVKYHPRKEQYLIWRNHSNHDPMEDISLKQSENVDHIGVVFHWPGLKHTNTRIKDLLKTPEKVSLQFAKEGDTLIPKRNKFPMPSKFPIPFFFFWRSKNGRCCTLNILKAKEIRWASFQLCKGGNTQELGERKVVARGRTLLQD